LVKVLVLLPYALAAVLPLAVLLLVAQAHLAQHIALLFMYTIVDMGYACTGHAADGAPNARAVA